MERREAGGPIPERELTEQQRTTLDFLRSNYPRLIDAVDRELDMLGIEKLIGRKLFAKTIQFDFVPLAQDNICCVCCPA